MLLQGVAKTIYRQLGAGRFQAMTGSKEFVQTENSLSFRVGSNPKRVTHVTVTLAGDDTYTVKSEKVSRKLDKSYAPLKVYHPSTRATVAEVSDIYCDKLGDTFTQLTGLYTRL